MLHKAASEKVLPRSREWVPEMLSWPAWEPQVARDERLGHFRSPALERVQRARRGFMQQPPWKAAVHGEILSGRMSEENVEIVRRYFAAYDSGGLDALAEFWHPDIDWRAVEGYIDDVGLIRGPDGLRQYYRQWEETFDAVRIEIEELTKAGDEVVALLRGVGRMKGSDAEIDIPYAVVISIRDGKIARGREYSTREEALEAAGLSE